MSFNLTKQVGFDPKLVSDGVRIDLTEDGAYIIVARAGNPLYIAIMREISAPYQQQIALNSLKPETLESLFIKGEARGILRGWGAIVDGPDDKDIGEYTPELAEKVLTDWPDFRKMVKKLSEEAHFFRAQQVEATKEILGEG